MITNASFYLGDEAKLFFIELNFTNKDDKSIYFICRDLYPLETLRFDISCKLKKAGEFYLSISAAPATLL